MCMCVGVCMWALLLNMVEEIVHYIHAHVYVCVCVIGSGREHMGTCMCTYVCVWTSVSIYNCMSVCVHVCDASLGFGQCALHMCMHAYCMHMYLCVCACVYVCMCVCVYVWVYGCMDVCMGVSLTCMCC